MIQNSVDSIRIIPIEYLLLDKHEICDPIFVLNAQWFLDCANRITYLIVISLVVVQFY
jgi:hypothetical protein